MYTVDAEGHAIDMGFIVCNRERYPRFCALLDELGIETRPTTMSLSVCHDGLEWGSESLSAMFAQRRRIIDTGHWRFLVHVVRFLLGARADLRASATQRPAGTRCDWLALSPRDHLLEIGCGWGGMAIHAARTRGCRVTAITLSREQHALASTRVAAAGLADRVAIEYGDYRDVEALLGIARPRHAGRDGFDKIVSIEMLEQVGSRTCRRSSRPARGCLHPMDALPCNRSRCPTSASRRISPASTGCRPTGSPARGSRRSP